MMLLRLLIEADANDIPRFRDCTGAECTSSLAQQLGLAIQSLEAVGPKLETPGRKVCLGDHSGNSIWFPPFNQVTQAWNAQLCQTDILDA